MKSKLKSYLNSIATDDYQRRGGGYPKSNIPVLIEVRSFSKGMMVQIEFKSTTEKAAKNWTERNIIPELKKLKANYKITTRQEGDYKDDWVVAEIEIQNTLREKVDKYLKEGRMLVWRQGGPEDSLFDKWTSNKYSKEKENFKKILDKKFMQGGKVGSASMTQLKKAFPKLTEEDIRFLFRY